MRKVAVCIKQIPLVDDANFDPVTKTIRRDGINIIGAYDLTAIAEAVALKRQFGAETTVATMGPPQARAALADALAMGIDRARWRRVFRPGWIGMKGNVARTHWHGEAS